MTNIDDVKYTDEEIALATRRATTMRWTDSVFGSWADHQYPDFSAEKFKEELKKIRK